MRAYSVLHQSRPAKRNPAAPQERSRQIQFQLTHTTAATVAAADCLYVRTPLANTEVSSVLRLNMFILFKQ